MRFIKKISIILKLMIVATNMLISFEGFGGAGTLEYYTNTKENSTIKNHGDYSGGTSFDGSGIGNNINLNTNTLVIDLAGLKTWNDAGDVVFQATLYYRVYKEFTTPGSFMAVNLPIFSESGNDREWQNGTDINLLSGLTTTGTYIVEIYFDADVNPNGGGSSFKIFRSNNGDNYKANFDVATSLPVELTNFFIVSSRNSTSLTWSTATELNNSHFDLQRSADSRNWETIGTVQGHGTTLEPQEYSYTDRQPLPGMNYYRLKQVDYDGGFEYSKTVSVDFKDTGRPGAVWPNPVGNELFLTLPPDADGPFTATIFDMNGKVWQQAAVSGTALAVGGLPAGMYFVKMVDADKQTVLQVRFVKE